MLLSQHFLLGLALLLTILSVCCSTNSIDDNSTKFDSQIRLERVFNEIARDNMVHMETAPGIQDRLFLGLKTGEILIINTLEESNTETIFLDISNKVNSVGQEEGLLGFTFDNDYADNHWFYVYYSAKEPRRSIVSRFSSQPNNHLHAQPQSETILLEIEQPYSNHNGGNLQFGPDGFLYIGLGDGGSRGDPLNHGQNISSLLGSILRIDVSNNKSKNTYSIPTDNPFINNTNGFKEEIWAYGLRNPWKFSFDSDLGTLWAADVGQSSFEEINIIKKGGNYGWNKMEGAHCYNRSWNIAENENCKNQEYTLPIFEYPHETGNCSITGGYVYRGSEITSLIGKYVYGDFCSGKIWALENHPKGIPSNTLLINSNLPISSFAQDSSGELYVLSYKGAIYRLTPKS